MEILKRISETSGVDDKVPQMVITDIPFADSDTCHTFLVKGVTNSEILARVSRFDVLVLSNEDGVASLAEADWAFYLQLFAILATVAIIVLVVILLLKLHRSIRRSGLFHWRSVRTLRTIAILMLLTTLSVDLSVYLERKAAYELLCNTDWAPQLQFTIHFSRLLFALIVFFVAELIHMGHKMQQEQDLTI